MDAPSATEFARPIELSRLNHGEQRFEIIANAAERAALAARFGLVDLDKLAAAVRLGRIAGGLVRLEAELDADITQTCVVTLEPVKSRIAENFTVLYGEGSEAREVTLDGEAETIEPIVGGVIDIGEAVAQQLSLVLDPFPHAPGVAAVQMSADSEAGVESPFKVLAQLRNKNDSKD
ncbi:MAG: YceD family protein [Stellaceae bacterium]